MDAGDRPNRMCERTVLPAAVTSTILPTEGAAPWSPEKTVPIPWTRRRLRKPNPSRFSSPNTIREMRSSPHAIWGLSADARARTAPSDRSTRAPASVLVPRSSATPSGFPACVAGYRGANGPSPAMSFPSMYAARRAGLLSGGTVTIASPERGRQRQASRIPFPRSVGGQPPQVAGEGGRLLRPDKDAPARKILDPAGQPRHHPRENKRPVADRTGDAALGEGLRDALGRELPGRPGRQHRHPVAVRDQ